MDNYIFTFEDGRHFVATEITDDDINSVQNGILTIIRCIDAHELNELGEWASLPNWKDVANG